MQAVSVRSPTCRAAGAHHTRRLQHPLGCHARLLCRAAPLVYLATRPLVGWEKLEVILKDNYPDELALHCMVLIESEESVTMFDFLPEQPKSPVVAAALLCGSQVKGTVRERRLSRLPVRRCWLVGPSATQQVRSICCRAHGVGLG